MVGPDAGVPAAGFYRPNSAPSRVILVVVVVGALVVVEAGILVVVVALEALAVVVVGAGRPGR
jgi:hypothetical protein